MTATYVLVCDLGGTRLRVAVATPEGSLQSKQVIATPADGPSALARTMRDVLDCNKDDVSGVVVGVRGPVNYAQGKPLKLPNLPGWEGHISSSALEDELGFPVLMANDADLAALGEHRYGAGRGSRDMVYVTSSTGVGAGVILGAVCSTASYLWQRSAIPSLTGPAIGRSNSSDRGRPCHGSRVRTPPRSEPGPWTATRMRGHTSPTSQKASLSARSTWRTASHRSSWLSAAAWPALENYFSSPSEGR